MFITSDLMGFKNYLLKEGYKEFTPSGHPSTIHSYLNAIISVANNEKVSVSEIAKDIGKYCAIYGEGGPKEEFGKKGHSTVINALERFKEYLSR